MQAYGRTSSRPNASWRRPSARPAHVRLLVPDGNELGRQIGLLFQSNLAAIGVTLNLKETPWAQMVQASASAETNPDVASIFDTLKYPHPDSHTYGMYHPSAWGSYRTISRYKNDEVTKMLEQARATVEREPQLALYKKRRSWSSRTTRASRRQPVHRIASATTSRATATSGSSATTWRSTTSPSTRSSAIRAGAARRPRPSMREFLLRRLIQVLPTVLGLLVLIFVSRG